MTLLDLASDIPKLGPRDTIVTRACDLPDLSDCKRVCWDTETTSFDDTVPALNPYKGHRIAGLAVSVPDGDRAWYIPVRHHGVANEGHEQVPLENFQVFLRDLLTHPNRVEAFGHNVKFDIRFARFDIGHDVEICPTPDTMALAKLVNNTSRRLSLEELCEKYQVAEGKLVDLVSRWCEEAGTEDYGRVPIRRMGVYAIRDVRATRALRRVLEAKLPEFSRGVWETEKLLTGALAQIEHDGVLIDRSLLLDEWHAVMTRQLEIKKEVCAIVKWKDVDLNKAAQKVEILKQLKVPLTKLTKTGRVSTKKSDMETIVVPDEAGPEAKKIGKLFKEWNSLAQFSSTYLEGWNERAGDDDRLHPNLKQAWVVTGRLSAGDPNTQNIPDTAERMVIPPDGHVGIGADASQVEYRMFSHYTEDPTIAKAYREDPDADFHQFLADMMGVDRQFAKTLNFSFVFGMGRDKLLRTLVEVIALMDDTDRERALGRLAILTVTAGGGMVAAAESFAGSQRTREQESKWRTIAERIYNQYHDTFPTIRTFAEDVKRVVDARRYVRNLYGRRYTFDPMLVELSDEMKRRGGRGLGAHMAVNYLIQGSCADMLREKLVKAQSLRKRYGAKLYMTVHDSMFWYVPKDAAPEFYVAAKAMLEDVPQVSVPIRWEGKVFTRWMDAYVKISESRKKPRGLLRDEKNENKLTWCTGGSVTSPDDVREALALCKDVPHLAKSAVETHSGYRIRGA